MRNSILVLALSGLLVAAPALAKPSKEENIGVGTGAVIGAVAGGPVGFLIGAAFGAKIGDEFHQRNSEVGELTASLQGSTSEIAQLQQDIGALKVEMTVVNGELTRVQSVAKPELLQLLQAGIEMDLLFRTDEHVLADTTGSRLTELAATLSAMPDVHVQLDGFADERGNATYNQQLSGKRAEHVKNVLIMGGIAESRISVKAHGESIASDENIDSYAFERRVSLTLYIDDTPSFASNPGT
jgi:outer membrane protein OmpA-like peptidoglycan-associated protein